MAVQRSRSPRPTRQRRRRNYLKLRVRRITITRSADGSPESEWGDLVADEEYRHQPD
jgi:hypothetical protein